MPIAVDTVWIVSSFEAGAEIDGRFRIVEQRGAGSMGVVYRAEDIWLGRPVAIKTVDAELSSDEAVSRLFQQEARSLAQIRHENVVNVYSFGKHAGMFYFAMEYVDGVSLETIIEEHAARGQLVDLGHALLILRAIARGLGAVHQRNLVHRDVKPGNIVVEHNTGRPVLVDFGLARRTRTTNPRATATAGTPSYMAPEQARDVDGTKTTAAADVYALACTAFELLTGKAVFEREDIYAVLLAHLNETPPTISSLRPDLAGLDPIFARALAKMPEARPKNCARFIVEVDLVMSEALEKRSELLRRPNARLPTADAMRVFLLERDDALARQITRAADNALDVPVLERFLVAEDLVGTFEGWPADVVVLDEDAVTGSCAAIATAIQRFGHATEIIVLTRNWQSGTSGLAELGVRELPKPLNMQILTSVLRGAGDRSRASRATSLP